VIVDSSALIALAMVEPDYRQYEEAMLQGRPLLMSAASFLEAAIVVDGKGDPVVHATVRRPARGAFGIEIADVTTEQARIARRAYRDFGRGSGHRARLNFGDCLSYALAVDRDEPLLFKGGDLDRTGVRPARD
jgi:ribonuclease VapC